jgi:hypothetical protein
MRVAVDLQRHGDECAARAKYSTNADVRDLWLRLARAWSGLCDADELLASADHTLHPTRH